MDHLVTDGMLKEEEGLCNDPSKLHKEADGHLNIPSTEFETSTTVFCGQTVHKGISLGANTPNPNRESIDVLSDAESPLSSVSSPLPTADCFNSPTSGSLSAADAEADSSQDGSPCTPKGTFDPFAPGPEDMALAPICNRAVKKSQNIVARRLKFDDSDDSLGRRNQEGDIETLSEEIILEYVYETLLEAVVLKQTEVFLAENPASNEVTDKTPSDAKLTVNADFWPAAPMKKVVTKSSNIDTVRRKLEF